MGRVTVEVTPGAKPLEKACEVEGSVEAVARVTVAVALGLKGGTGELICRSP